MTLRIFKNLNSKTLSSSQQERKASDHWPFYSNMLSLSSIHKPHALIGYLSFHTLGLGFYGAGQQVSSLIRYGMTYLLIRDVVGSVPCSYE
jgi:hypothetical protein